jgi:hypothetical protein
MADLPAPPIPAYVDLRTFDEMPLNVVRLMNADILFETSGDEFKAAVLLWARAWHQVPAGSLPDDDVKLAYMAGLGRDQKSWKKVKTGALRGFQACSDGRLYHEVICDAAVKSWAKKSAGTEGAEARWRKANELKNNNTGDANPDSKTDDTLYIEPSGPPSGESRGKRMPRTELNRTDKPPTPLGEGEWGRLFEEEFWPAYPSRGESANPKKPAREKFIAACKRGEDPAHIIAGAKAYAANPSTKIGTPYVATALVWLNQERWKDCTAAPAQKPANGTKVNGHDASSADIPTLDPEFPPEAQIRYAKSYLLTSELSRDGKEVKYTGVKPVAKRIWRIKNTATDDLYPGPGQPGCPIHDLAFKRVAAEFGAQWP